MYETELCNVERAAEGSNCGPGLAARFSAAGELELLGLENGQKEEGARPFQMCTVKGQGASCNEEILLGYQA